MDTWHPPLTYPGITLERLLLVADIIRVAREDAVEDHRPEKWETNWSLGVRQYERTCGSITWASQEYHWLRVLSGAGGGAVQYVFSIGGHPIRFCRGGPEDVPERYRQPCFPELEQQLALFEIDGALPQGRCLRIAIENAPSGRPTNIYLDELDEATGQPINHYLIPGLGRSTTVTEFVQPVPAVDIPPVSAEPTESEVGKKSREQEKTGSDDK